MPLCAIHRARAAQRHAAQLHFSYQPRSRCVHLLNYGSRSRLDETVQGTVMNPVRLQLSIVQLVGIAILLAARVAAGAADEKTVLDGSRVVFNRDIRPLLSENCFKCHGPDAGARRDP